MCPPRICVPTHTSHIYIFTYINSIVEGSPFFEGSNKYARYAKLFMTLVKENMDDPKTMGVGEGDICTHYFRKCGSNMLPEG